MDPACLDRQQYSVTKIFIRNLVRTIQDVKDAQIVGARSPWPQKCIRWRLIVVGPQCETCSMSLFLRLEFWDGA
jgi:hypothetical protein